MTLAADLSPYDGVLVLSFGGPEAPDEVLPFLRRVTAGRGIPDERLAEVGEHYFARGGVSPINAETRALAQALEAELERRGHTAPLAWGNRNSAPFLVDALRTLHEGGARRVVTVLTSAYAGYSSCRQYREDLAAAHAELAAEGRSLTIDKIRPYAVTRGFLEANARLIVAAVAAMAGDDDAHDAPPEIVLVTHSVPQSASDRSGPPAEHGPGGGAYLRQHLQVCDTVLARVSDLLGRPVGGQLVFCSRSGAPGQAWLEPDVNEHLERLAARGVRRVVIAPIGFVSDHMEVVHDLDTEAMDTAQRLGLEAVRVPTVRCAPEHVAGLADLLEERAAQARGADATAWAERLGGDLPAVCAAGCCPGRTPKAALAEEDR